MATPRKFDHDEARRLRAAGVSYAEIARRMGVTDKAVARVCDAAQGERMYRAAQKWLAGGVCPDCGGPATRQSLHKQMRCRKCSSLAAATTARDGELRCYSCGEWKPDNEFPFHGGNQSKYARRGRKGECRACLTKLRQAYRERHKVPCACCGKPALPPNEKTTAGAPFARCRECFHAGRVPEQVAV